MGSKSKAIGTVLVVAMLAQAFARDRKIVMDRALIPSHVKTLARRDASDADRSTARAALVAQIEIDPRRVLATLLPLLKEEDSPDGLKLLASVDGAVATEGLVEVAVEHANLLMRREAVRALVGRKDLSSIDLLYRIADDDPSLIVRQEAVVGLAELGDDAVLRDLVALLHPLAPGELTARARTVLLRFTDMSFRDAVDAYAWMNENGISPSQTSIGVPDSKGATLTRSVHGLDVRMERTQIVFESAGAPPRSGRIILDHDSGSVLLEVRNVDGEPVGRALDIPEVGAVSERYAMVRGKSTESGWTLALPRTAQLKGGATRVEWIDGREASSLASGDS